MSATPGAPVDPAQSNSETLPLRSMVGEFEILGIIGEGGFGTVYLAMDHSLNRKVALKEYRPAALATRTATTIVLRSQRHAEAFAAGLKSFINEARTLARFDHPALVRVYRFWQENGTAYMAMPLVEGSTLTSIVRDRRPSVTESWLRQILAPLLDAIEALHGVQIYHRDIAPDNVLIQQNGTPVLLDFGAAREIVAAQTQALTVILKPGYAPVEQYAEDAGMKQGPWTDIYAIGAVMQFAVIGRAPPNSVTRLMNDSRVPLLQEMPAGFTAEFLGAIDKALTVRPEARPQNIAELRELFGMTRDAGSESSTGFSLHPNAPASSPTQFGGGLAGPVSPPADQTTIILPGKHDPIPATETREPAMGAAPGKVVEATPGRTPPGTSEAPVPERRRSKAPLLWGA
ncbi:MAG: protein kinase, partial [Casimicrobiaceae bacterium]